MTTRRKFFQSLGLVAAVPAIAVAKAAGVKNPTPPFEPIKPNGLMSSADMNARFKAMWDRINEQ